SHPTEITNPLFPVSRQASVLLLGQVGGLPFRTEVTLLDETRIIEWQGQRVEVAVSQYSAYLDGKITEIAIDFYAQADDGSVWYFGEDVFDFRDGAIVVTEGSWLAGRDGPAAMIMPADPRVGYVYRPENAPGFVFEEVTVASVNEALDGPLGPIEGGMIADELHMDGGHEQKVFAPGYGEFLTGGGGDVEALALAVPTDASSEPMPGELTALSDGALAAFDALESEDWSVAAASGSDMAAAWETHRASDVPRLIEPLMTDALGAFADAVDAQDAAQARQAAIEVARFAFDLQLRFRTVVEVDLDRLGLWAAQLMVDAAADDQPAFNADAFALDYVRDRIVHALNSSDRIAVSIEVGAIQGAVLDEDLAAGAEAAASLRSILAGLEPAS
ncbi:MAG TPA: hypothetical protein VEW45_05730, partial [Candidatus Dormibacteraeota bacterium]|nr:hypothetical protein [Candidatus Dormibacteraeota bacterium]